MTIKPYSPTQTQAWLRCPILRELSRDWESRWVGKRELAALLGRGFAAGVAIYNLARWNKTTLQASKEEAVETGRAYVTSQLTRYAENYVINDFDVPLRDSVIPRLTRILTDYPAIDLIPETWTVVGVEQTLPSRARIDVAMDADGRLVIIDYKTKGSLSEYYRNIAIEEWRNSWQMYHYVWEYGLGTPGNWPGVTGRTITDYYIVLVTCEPRPKCELLPFTVHPESLARWEASAWRVWEQMAKEDAGEALPWMAAVHRDQYGPCEYYKACFELFYNESLMEKDYVRKVRNVK